MNCKIKQIPLSRIRMEEDHYRITTEADLRPLSASVAAVGLIAPPLLAETGDEFQIISGFRRVAACHGLEWTEIEAKVFGPDISEADCVRLAVSDNALQRQLNLIEMSRAFQLLRPLCRDMKALAASAADLGLPSNHGMIRKVLPLCRLPLPVQEGILAETLPLPIALDLGNLPPEEMLAFADIFNTLRLSLNKQREVLSLVREIAARDDLAVADVLKSDAVKEILEHPDYDRNRKARLLRISLRQRRFPNLAHAEQILEEQVRQLKLGNGVRLIPPKDFEGRAYSFHLEFKTPDDLNARRSTLDRVSASPVLRQILDGYSFD
ncbi:hypothetical protein DENIS_1582 [Desulfonema ishimotonii]|uniref:ParB-like N-terminal domain-containing protein n=1 Tax=Desulfonema ishimotonii TaxID=45657 RepID=A0A401FUJ4_9BACT|nr:ParB N-terminal domain-containing protein [Desulfonema ishimotonii]GBC60625.1 hypothetical protein DENIS_1582 [Desulfonema ishimotonii]